MARERHSRDGLTERQRRFVSAFAENGGNATAAAKTAGYSGGAQSLAVLGGRALKNEAVRAALAAKGVEIAEGNRSCKTAGRAAPGAPKPPAHRPRIHPDRDPLSPAQFAAITSLLAGSTHAAAAAAAGVERPTVTHWLGHDVEFRAELDAQRLAALERARLRVEQLADAALEVAHAVLSHAGLCAECGAEIDPPSKEASTMALAMLDRAGVGSRALDVPALRERLESDAMDAVIRLAKELLDPALYRQFSEALIGEGE